MRPPPFRAPSSSASKRRRPSALTRYDSAAIVALAIAAALGAVAVSAAPTGFHSADVVIAATAAGLVTMAGSKARRWAGLVLAAVACAVASGLLLIPAAFALVLSLAVTNRFVRLRLVGAVVAALSMQVLFRQDPIGFHGASSLIGVAAPLPVLISAHNLCRSRIRRRTHRILGATSSILLLATAAFGVAMILARHDLEVGATRARSALQAARSGDARTAQRKLSEAANAFRRSASLTGSWWAAPARVVPLVGQQARAVALVTEEGRKVVRSAQNTAAVGDYHRLKYRTGRFDVARLRELQGPLANSAATLVQADHQLADLDRSWLMGPLRSRLDEFAKAITRATPEAALASSVVDAAPGLLGADGTRHYFIAFITPAELRGAGGFIGNYGELTARNGRVRLTRSGPISDLLLAAPPGKRRLTGPADYLRRYGEFSPADYFQDVTFSPHFPFDANVIEQLYPQSGGRRVDGVLSVDPFALAALLRFTGPIVVPGLDTPLTSANAADTLLRQQYVRFGDRKNRKDLLVEASRITFDKLTKGSLPAPRELARVLGPMVSQRRIMLHAIRPSEQRLFTRLRADGALPTVDGGDVLSVVTSNRGNDKIDTFLHRDLSYSATIDPSTSRVSAALTVKLRNDAPQSGLPSVIIGNPYKSPSGTNLMTLSLYSPLGLDLATLDGRPIGMQPDEEAGLGVYSLDLAIPPRTTRVFRFQLAGGLDLETGYRLVVAPQPVTNPDWITVDVRTRSGWHMNQSPGLQLRGSFLTSGRRRLSEEERYTVDGRLR